MAKLNIKNHGISEKDVDTAISFLSERKAASTVQITFGLGVTPTESMDLIKDLVGKGFVSGSSKSYETVGLDEFFSLTEKGARRARAIKKKVI